jgi:hypothetical protein
MLACSVCYGNPEDPMTKAALAGVLVLGGFVLGVLLWITVVGIYFVRRARRVAEENGTPPRLQPTQTVQQPAV